MRGLGGCWSLHGAICYVPITAGSNLLPQLQNTPLPARTPSPNPILFGAIWKLSLEERVVAGLHTPVHMPMCPRFFLSLHANFYSSYNLAWFTSFWYCMGLVTVHQRPGRIDIKMDAWIFHLYAKFSFGTTQGTEIQSSNCPEMLWVH